jgi:hypothetical protein
MEHDKMQPMHGRCRKEPTNNKMAAPSWVRLFLLLGIFMWGYALFAQWRGCV